MVFLRPNTNEERNPMDFILHKFLLMPTPQVRFPHYVLALFTNILIENCSFILCTVQGNSLKCNFINQGIAEKKIFNLRSDYSPTNESRKGCLKYPSVGVPGRLETN